MSDISITAANVLPGSNAAIDRSATAAASITAGQIVYKNTSGAWDKADSNATGTRQPGGVALHAAAAGQPLAVQTKGDITIGGALTAGVEYYLSANAGGICPVADLTTGMDSVPLGVAKSATVLGLNIQISGVTL